MASSSESDGYIDGTDTWDDCGAGSLISELQREWTTSGPGFPINF